MHVYTSCSVHRPNVRRIHLDFYSLLAGDQGCEEWPQDMIIPDEHTITQLVAAVCGPQTEVDDHQQSIFLPNAISDDAVADWDSESGGSDSLSEIEEHKSMSNIPTPPRDRESHSPDNDHTLGNNF
jgi:hypothetical protein